MRFENCHYHPQNINNLLIYSHDTVQTVCEQCFHSLQNQNIHHALLLNENILRYFFEWNRYLITELNSLIHAISQQGTSFFIQCSYPNLKQPVLIICRIPNNQTTINALLKQVSSFVIHNHINLLAQNISYIQQNNNKIDIKNSHFLQDLYIIRTKPVQNILNPIKLQFQAIMKRQLGQQVNMKWNPEVIEAIQKIRKQIILDWAQGSLIEKRLNTEHPIGKQKSSSGSQTTDINEFERNDSNNSAQSDLQSESQSKIYPASSQDSENIQEAQALLIKLRAKNQEIRMKDHERKSLYEQVFLLQGNCQQWERRYYDLQQNYKTLIEARIPSIDKELVDIEKYLNDQIEQNLKYTIAIQQLQKNLCMINQLNQLIRADNQRLSMENIKMNEENMKLNEELKKLSEEQPKHYINPHYEKSKNQEKLFVQIIELQSDIIQKTQDIQLLLNCLQLTKQFINNNQYYQIQCQQINNPTKKWQQQMAIKLNSLHTLKINFNQL